MGLCGSTSAPDASPTISCLCLSSASPVPEDRGDGLDEARSRPLPCYRPGQKKIACTFTSSPTDIHEPEKHRELTAKIWEIFRESFEAAGLPYFNPHSFRHTLAQLGERLCRTPEEFKAWSQNLGHEKVLTTFQSYGTVASGRQAEIIRILSVEQSNGDELDRIVEQLQRIRRGPDQAGGVGR